MRKASTLAFWAAVWTGPLILGSGCGPQTASDDKKNPGPDPAITFTADVAPIIFEHCASCHRPGQSAPFQLLSYQDVAKHGRQIVEVTQSRYMPPWLPAQGYAEFVGERRLTLRQIQTLERWVEQGAREGDAARLPRLPVWSEGWQLGTPDLVVSMEASYTLAAEGPDVYRNFVIPIPGEERRYVKAVQFDPNNAKIVHHAFFLLDRTGSARREDALDEEPGFSGIHTPADVKSPDGFFLSWQPGKQPAPSPDGMAWLLEPGTDLVVQLHLQTSGKPESIQSRLAFYFTQQPPVNEPLKLWLSTYQIDIPAGQRNYVVEDSYVLPAGLEVLGILPHAHYLAREMQSYALLPDGTKRWLIWIKQWDFNWQGDYRYREPIPLPKGTRVVMRYTYDNSTHNVNNPHDPPQRTRYGLQSTDEMAELWLQVLPDTSEGRQAVQDDYRERALEDSVAYNQFLLRQNGKDARAHGDLGKAFLYQGRFVEAQSALNQSINLEPNLPNAHYFLGLLHRTQGRPAEALDQFEQVVRIDPSFAKAHGNIGFIMLEQGQLDRAEYHLQRALELAPDDALARSALQDVARARSRQPE